jgi:hypothetical protein
MRNNTWFVSRAAVIVAIVVLASVFMSLGFLVGQAFPYPESESNARTALGPSVLVCSLVLFNVTRLVFAHVRHMAFKFEKIHVAFHEDGRMFLVKFDDKRTPPDSPISE